MIFNPTIIPRSAPEGGGARPKDINLYDYDGTLLHSYTREELQSLTVLPDGPSHEGLVFQGWNWPLDKLKALTRPMDVGAMYITDDGATRLHIRIWDLARSNVPLYFSQTASNGVSIDWGDGSSAETLPGTGNVRTSHQYTEAGNYTISLLPADGCELGLGHGSGSYCVLGSTANTNAVYRNLLQSAHIGRNVPSIGNRAFYNCISLASVTIPDSVTSVVNYAFYNCFALASVTIPDSVTSVGNYAFYNCYPLASVTIPGSVTSIGDYAFVYCYSLASVTIPDSVTTIGVNAFANCYGVAEYRLLPTTPPALANATAFTGIAADCVIYVPNGSLAAYQTAENWAAYADKMREEAA